MKKNRQKKVRNFSEKIQKIDYRKILNEKNLKTYDEFWSTFFTKFFFSVDFFLLEKYIFLELNFFLRYYFDSEKAYLSIGGIFGAILCF